jgi:hypothetical protein
LKNGVDEAGVVNRKDELEKLFEQFGEKIDMLATDVGVGGWTFLSAHEKINALNKGQRLISKSIWITHGGEDSFSFGSHGLDCISSHDDPREKVDWELLKACYIPHPQICVFACSSGLEGGPVQKVSRMLDALAMGATIDFNWYEFVHLQGMQPTDQLQVEINGGDAFVNIFDKGELVTKSA